MKQYFSYNRIGSSLLVAILVMGVLLTLTLGLSSLVIREITQTADVVAAGKAYFAAEAGVENALLDLNQHLPGYQTKGLAGAVDEWVSVSKNDDIDYRYRIRNKGDKFPYFDADQPIYLTPGVAVTKDYLYNSSSPEDAARATYNVLVLNDTVTIPLFTDCGDGSFSDVKDFLLEYFVDFDLDPNLDMGTYGGLSNKLEDFDVLRWKVFGLPVYGDPGGPSRTHAISDFYPAKTGDSPTNPVCIGTDMGLGSGCQFPAAKFVKNDAEYISDYSKSTSVYEDVTNVWSQARQCYLRDVGSAVAATDIQKGCGIKTFIDSHKKSYLTITNIVNPGIIGISNPLLRAQRANIYYRVIAKGDSNNVCKNQFQNDQDVIVREYADVSADGFASGEKVKQSIDVKLKLNSFLPVFSFSLYNADPTKTGKEVDVSSLPLSL